MWKVHKIFIEIISETYSLYEMISVLIEVDIRLCNKRGVHTQWRAKYSHSNWKSKEKKVQKFIECSSVNKIHLLVSLSSWRDLNFVFYHQNEPLFSVFFFFFCHRKFKRIINLAINFWLIPIGLFLTNLCFLSTVV